MNSFTATARLTRDPELKTLPSGSSVCEMRVAINRPDGKTADYIDVASYGAGGEAAAKYLTKGSLVAITGRIEYREWKAQDGSSRSTHRVVGHLEFLGSRKDTDQSSAQPAGDHDEVNDNDIDS